MVQTADRFAMAATLVRPESDTEPGDVSAEMGDVRPQVDVVVEHPHELDDTSPVTRHPTKQMTSDIYSLMTFAVLAVVLVGVTRLVVSQTWLVPVYAAAGAATITHRVRTVRRQRAATITATLVGVTVASVMVYGQAWVSGHLFESLTAASTEITDAVFRSKVPVAATPGLVFGLAVLAAVSAAVTQCVSPRHPVRVLIVPVVWFVTVLVTAARSVETGSVMYASAVAAVTLWWWATQRLETRDVAPSVRRSVTRNAVILASVAVLAGAVIGPRLPGATSPALLAMFRPTNSTGVSPLVEIGGRIENQTTTIMFTVEADRPISSYWRITTLDEFNGQTWFPGPGRDAVYGEQPAGDVSTYYTFTVKGLNGDLLPGPVSPKVTSTPSAVFGWGTGEITDGYKMDRDAAYPDRTYMIGAVAPPSADTLRATTVTPTKELERWLETPDGFENSRAAQIARDVTDGHRAGYDTLHTLEQWFTTGFTYNLGTDYTHEPDPVTAFLDRKVGYCQQFAGTFAAMARSLGYPTRVAVGYTAGAVDPTNPNRWTVMGADAHAWPEVWFGPDLGWVAFEPTPTRAVNQPTITNQPSVPAPSLTASPTTTVAPAEPSRAGTELETVAGPPTPTVPDERSSVRIEQVAAAVGWLTVVFLVFFVVDRVRLRARRRRLLAAEPAVRVLAAWDDIVERAVRTAAAKPLGATNTEWATPIERGIPALRGLVDVAATVDSVLFSDDPGVTLDAAMAAETVRDTMFVAAATHPAFVVRRTTFLGARTSGRRRHIQAGQVVVVQEPSMVG